MNLKQPDPVLKTAIREISEICNKHDIGGYIVLSSKTHGEYFLHFPKWSKCFFEETPDGSVGIRFRSKGSDKETHELTTSTVHMIQVFQEQGNQIAKGMDHLLELLESKMVIAGGPKRI